MTNLRDRLCSLLDVHSRACVRLAVVLVTLVGLAYSVHLADGLRYHDEREYLHLAENLLGHGILTYDGVTKTAFRPPGYPAFLAGLEWLGAGLVARRFAQFLLLAGSIGLLARLARAQHGRAAAALSAILVLAFPALIYTAGVFYPQTLAGFLFLTALNLLCLSEPPKVWASLLAGATLGAAVLTVPTFIVSAGVVLAWLLNRHGRAAIGTLACSSATLLLALGAWSWRNVEVFGSMVFVSTNSGLNLFIGNNEHATPLSGVDVEVPPASALGEDLNEAQQDAAYKKLALDWIRDHPGRATRLYLGKLLHYFAIDDKLATASEENPLHAIIMAFTYLPLLAVSAWRLLLARRRHLSGLQILLVFLYLGHAFFMALFFCRIRFRVPYDLLLIGLSATSLVEIVCPLGQPTPCVSGLREGERPRDPSRGHELNP